MTITKDREDEQACNCLLCQMNKLLLQEAEANQAELDEEGITTVYLDDLTEAEQLEVAVANLAAFENGEGDFSSDDAAAILRYHGYVETTVEDDDDDEDIDDVELDGLSFGQALIALKEGFSVSRAGWNGENQFLRLVDPNGSVIVWEDNRYALKPWIGIKTVDNGFVPWLASQGDMLAEDWTVLV